MTRAHRITGALLFFLAAVGGTARAEPDYALSAKDKKDIVDYKKQDTELGKKGDPSYPDRFADEGIDVKTGEVTVTDSDKEAFAKELRGLEQINNGIKDLGKYCGVKIPVKEDFALFKIMRQTGVGDNVLEGLAGICKVGVDERPKRAALVGRVKAIHLEYEGFGCKKTRDGRWGQAMRTQLAHDGTLEVFVRVGPWGADSGCDYQLERDALMAVLNKA